MTSDGGACSPRRTRKRATDSHNGDLSHSEEIEVVEETKSEEEEEKIVTTGKKGVAVLVQWLPDYVEALAEIEVATKLKLYSYWISSCSSQKYIGEKVGVDEKLPWTQSVIGKGFMGVGHLGDLVTTPATSQDGLVCGSTH
ncbi:hypothetical protein JHK82_052916 [Glycine max]|nr:hypothetical protein JHK85_053622 [Glycine max]KAG5085519.1 hypothetical protein JHK82_052916 [Glycine max]